MHHQVCQEQQLPNPILLGVNVDHVATVRQARGVSYPDPVHAALQAEMAGANGITMHLREDRRHIQDEDVERFAACTQTKLNFEMAATEEMLAIALRIKPTGCLCRARKTRRADYRGRTECRWQHECTHRAM